MNEIAGVRLGNLAEALVHRIDAQTRGVDPLKAHPGRGPTILDYGMHRLLTHAEQIGVVGQDDQIRTLANVQYRKALVACESPIESDMLAALLTGNWPFSLSIAPLSHVAKDYDEPFPLGDVVIVPQLAFLRYRLDLGIIVERDRGKAIVGVECDGAEFHQDRDRDAARDDYFRCVGVPVFRIRGAQIYSEPTATADTIIAAIEEWRARP